LRETLRWKDENGKIVTQIDNLSNEKSLFQDLRKQIDDMYKTTQKRGNNSYPLNFFSFSGFGFVNMYNDSIFLVPTKSPAHDDWWELNQLNIDEEARRFATKENSINIFLVSASRQHFDHHVCQAIKSQQDYFDKEEENKENKNSINFKVTNNKRTEMKGISIVVYGSYLG
jgi:hypothetical protein